MASAYHEALLLRLRHIVGVRRNTKLWVRTGDIGQRMIYASLKAAMKDAWDEGLQQGILDIITPEEVAVWR